MRVHLNLMEPWNVGEIIAMVNEIYQVDYLTLLISPLDRIMFVSSSLIIRSFVGETMITDKRIFQRIFDRLRLRVLFMKVQI